jgi:glutamate-5-semialdehyde dehydrogenase
MALEIAVNAKAQRPGTCNAMETLLVDAPVAAEFLPRLAAKYKEKNVRIHGCPLTAKIVAVDREAGEEEYRTRVPGSDLQTFGSWMASKRAMDHSAEYGYSRHTDSIVTRSYDGGAADSFREGWTPPRSWSTASTRLADGGVYGMGSGKNWNQHR